MDTKNITLVSEDGEEILAEILFTFENDGENFVLLTLVKEIEEQLVGEEMEVLAYKYEEMEDKEIGNLIEIADNSSDWEIVEEMFNTFMDTEFENEE